MFFEIQASGIQAVFIQASMYRVGKYRLRLVVGITDFYDSENAANYNASRQCMSAF